RWQPARVWCILGRGGDMHATVPIPARKRIALVAHDNCKAELIRWARDHHDALAAHELFATGTTGGRLAAELDLTVTRLLSGPLGGDRQMGAGIAENAIDMLIFFWDPLEPQPHDPDIKALLRVAVLCNIPTACNRATADFLLTSPLIARSYARQRSPV